MACHRILRGFLDSRVRIVPAGLSSRAGAASLFGTGPLGASVYADQGHHTRHVEAEAIALIRTSDWLGAKHLAGRPGAGAVSLGPAEFHGQITRDDVASTLAELLHEPRIGRQILELNEGSTPIEEAVQANVRQPRFHEAGCPADDQERRKLL